MLITLICFKSYYPDNKKATDFFENNNTLLNDYINTFKVESYIDKYSDDLLGEVRVYNIPNELKKVNVENIKYINSQLFFEIDTFTAYYGGIYYSFDNSCADIPPIYGNDLYLYQTDFRKIRNNVWLKGKKNNGTDWYKTEKIEDKWYCFDVHIA